jgi:exodeoxyribonuclease V alpha subunit
MTTLRPDESQAEAVERACHGDSLIVTGNAGTGKTATIKFICDALKARGRGSQTILMAPTGKAAVRISEATGYHASTVHRALGWDGAEFRGKPDRGRIVIIDEASMLDSWLLSSALSRLSPAQVILVGDDAQLPPVGRGQPFHDLIRLRPQIVTRLLVNHRNSAAINRAAMAIREGRAPEWSEDAGGEKWSMRDTGPGPDTEDAIVRWAKAGAIDPEQDVILAARYGGDKSDGGDIDPLNARLVEIFNPRGTEGLVKGVFLVGDRVLCCKNFPDLDLWNGDTGTVDAVDYGGAVWLKLDRSGEQVECKAEQRRELTLAYAMSVHKGQGSQFRRVIVVALRKHWHMLDRALLYTAVTRAKEGCCVVGEVKAFFGGINKVKQRRTVLQHLLGATGKQERDER